MEEEVLVLPPSAPDAEKATIGSALITTAAARWVLGNLSSEMFYSDRHRTIFEAIENVQAADFDVDLVTVAERLRYDGKLGDVGGPQYLQECQFSVGSAHSVEHYGRIVKSLWLERSILKATMKVRNFDKRADALEEISVLCRARDMVDARGGLSMKEAVGLVLDRMDDGPADMMRLGLGNLDRIIGGMEGGDLLTLGARTGSGKTATLLSSAVALARSGKRVAYFAGEMGGEQVAKRALSSCSRVPHWKIRERKMDRAEMGRVTAAARELADLPLFFCTIPSPSLRDIKSFADNVRADVVIVDYLGRCRLPKAENMRVSVNLFMVGIKNFARESNRRIMLAAQINRATDRQESPPKLADLKESGAIEEESDFVVLLYLKPEAKLADGTVNIEAAVAKNRHGKVGATDLLFEKEIMLVHGDLGGVPERAQTPELPSEPRNRYEARSTEN